MRDWQNRRIEAIDSHQLWQRCEQLRRSSEQLRAESKELLRHSQKLKGQRQERLMRCRRLPD